MRRLVPILTLAALLAAFAFPPGPARAQRSPAASDACFAQLQENYGADEVLNVTQRRNAGRRFVHMRTRLQDGRVVNYRCIVRNNSVNLVQSYDGSWEQAERIERVEEPEEPAEGEAPDGAAEDADGEAAEGEDGAGDEGEEASASREVYRTNLGDSFSPSEGITCYRNRAACFDADGRLDIRATGQQFPSE